MLKIKFQGPGTVTNKGRSNYRKYTHETLSNAYKAVVEDGMPILRAAQSFSVPYSTLLDRVRGRTKLNSTRPGPDTLLSQEEEQILVTHIQLMSSCGYGFSRTDITAMATDLAVHLGKKKMVDKQLSLQWFYLFMKRWPDLKEHKPRSPRVLKTKATSQETINRYFDELEKILEKHNLKDRPQGIYIIEEKGIVENHTSVAPSAYESDDHSSVTRVKPSTTTIIGCGNALGMALPPFFVFKGRRMKTKFLSGCTVGTNGTTSESGLSNSNIFERYLKEHFMKYSLPASSDYPILILYDGHMSPVSLSLIQWARENNIILFVLPAHTSHVLQPVDIRCFGPFEKIFSDMGLDYMRQHSTSGIGKHSMCEVASKAYVSALTPINLQASFRNLGIYPLDRCAINPSSLQSSSSVDKHPENHQEDSDTASPSGTAADKSTDDTTAIWNEFFKTAEAVLTEKSNPAKKRKVQKHQRSQPKKKPRKSASNSSPKPSTSGISHQRKKAHSQQPQDTSDSSDSDSDSGSGSGSGSGSESSDES